MLDCELEWGSCELDDSTGNTSLWDSMFLITFSGIFSRRSGVGVGSSSIWIARVLLQVGHLGGAPAKYSHFYEWIKRLNCVRKGFLFLDLTWHGFNNVVISILRKVGWTFHTLKDFEHHWLNIYHFVEGFHDFLKPKEQYKVKNTTPSTFTIFLVCKIFTLASSSSVM